MEAITGSTKDPGRQLFRRLKAEKYELAIDYENLVQFDFTAVTPGLQEVDNNVLTWTDIPQI